MKKPKKNPASGTKKRVNTKKSPSENILGGNAKKGLSNDNNDTSNKKPKNILDATTENASENKPRTSQSSARSRKAQSIEEKRKKDREAKKKKYDEDKELNDQQGAEQKEREDRELKLAIQAFACMPFDVIASRNPNFLPLSPEERETFTVATTALLDKYAPMVGKYQVETAFIITAASIIVPRTLFVNAKKREPNNGNSRQEGNGKDLSGKESDGVQV